MKFRPKVTQEVGELDPNATSSNFSACISNEYRSQPTNPSLHEYSCVFLRVNLVS